MRIRCGFMLTGYKKLMLGICNLDKMIMKPAGLKRALFALLLMCGVLVFYLFWHQVSPPLPGMTRNYQSGRRSYSSYNSYKKLDPMWTWQCNNQRCERHVQAGSNQPVSLATCNMLCGSTQLWPQPTGPVTLGSRAVAFFHNQIKLETSAEGVARDLIDQAFGLFNDSVAKMVYKTDSLVQTSEVDNLVIKVNVIRCDEIKLRLSTDESYSLTIRPNQKDLVVSINATTFFGARHGLETLSQLIWWDEFASGGMLKVLKGATVQDSPAFPYRGIMIDTSRNFMPVDSIKQVLVGMSANKLNIFHWHITDSQSFPFMSPKVPLLAKYGAYGPNMIYDADEIKDIVQFAHIRGIRVVIEVDTPAHAGNGWTWGPQEGLGDLAICINEQPWSLYCGEPPCGQLNPHNPNTYDVLEKLYKDILELSGEDEIFHLGGDEVNLECWAQRLHATTGNYTDLHDLWGEFTLKALQRLAKANGGKTPTHVLVWSSNLSKRPYTAKYLNKTNIVVQAWGPSQWGETVELLLDGYRLVISHVDAWYLDCGFGRWRETGEAACDPYRPWQAVYNHRPWQQPHVDKKMILGGEACLWSEQVDPDALDARLWPRAAAFAERVWSDPHTDTYIENIAEDVYTRLGTQRERLVQRGFAAEAMWPRWCMQNPGMCL